MSTATPTWFCCALCGWRFTHAGQVCGTCPLRPACDVVRCPSCGYQFPRSSRILGWLRRVLAGRSENR